MRAALALVFCSVAAAQPAEVASGRRLFSARCAVCHGTSARGGQGPGLAGVLGRKAGTQKGFGYSKALRKSDFTWDAAKLERFLELPERLVPGTKMVTATPSAEERHALVAFLSTLSVADAGEDVAPEPALASGVDAIGDYRTDGPGVRRRIDLEALPAPFASKSSRNGPSVVDPPAGAMPNVPPGFHVTVFAQDLSEPRLLRVAPNGDVFVAESAAGRITVLRGGTKSVFASGLHEPFGIAFYPPGADPTFVYVANTNAVVRFPYVSGDATAREPAQTVVPSLEARGGHWTRDLAFSPDGKRMFVSVGSASNVAEEMPRWPVERARAWGQSHGLGATWGDDAGRASVRVFTPEGGNEHLFATGLRNCVGLTVSPKGEVWCSTNERDGLGDNLVPDYVTHVVEGGFYGWPWFYLGDHEDPRRAGERPDLKGHVTVPDVLIQSHSAPLQMVFYDGSAFPPDYRGDAFVALHGSWNRSRRTGYKVIRVRMHDGVPTREYEDFLTGFVVDDDSVWGRPVGVAVAKDGALLVSEDGNGTLFRVAP